MPVTQHPLRRSVRAALPHTAPALGADDQTLVGVRVADAKNGNPVRDQSRHSTPRQVMGLTATAQGAMPQSADLQAEGAQARAEIGRAHV